MNAGGVSKACKSSDVPANTEKFKNEKAKIKIVDPD